MTPAFAPSTRTSSAAPRRPSARRRRCSLRPHRRRPRRRRRSPRRRRSTATTTTATATTSPGSGHRRERSSRRRGRGGAAALAEYEALDVTVVRGLASANVDAMSKLAEAAAQRGRSWLPGPRLSARRPRRASGPAPRRWPLDHRREWARRDPPRLEHGLQGRFLPPGRRRLRARRRAVLRRQRLQHRSGSGSSTRASSHRLGDPTRRSYLDTSRARTASSPITASQPARLPPGPLQRALPGGGLTDWRGHRRRSPCRPSHGQLPRELLVNAGLNAHSTTSGRTRGRRRRNSQDAYAEPGQLVAGRFGDSPNVLGYNLFNEPWPGSP